MRIPKDGFFAHQVMWDGWVDTEQPRIHIVGHWNYEAERQEAGLCRLVRREGGAVRERSVEGLRRAEFAVSLHLEGSAVSGRRNQSCGLRCWRKEALRDCDQDRGRSRGDQADTAHRARMACKADGADLALVDVEVVDANGNRCPTALNLIKFDLQGPAEWRGGIAVGPDNYILSKELPVECGINRVILRSQPQAGKIVLNASCRRP